ncbi:unnamed protein product [Rangifer tarandus platyrhynchus]|uniref:Uncharacterized protein n=1 Tax=Rangifer tarandus platyrhynchus TaxID=3082113 RepID=A0AC59ZLC2_RANTA
MRSRKASYGGAGAAPWPLHGLRIVLIQGPPGRAKDLPGTEGGVRPSLAGPKHLTVPPTCPSIPPRRPERGRG